MNAVEDVAPASIIQIIKYNKPEIPCITLGAIFTLLVAARPVVAAFVIAEILGVSYLKNYS